MKNVQIFVYVREHLKEPYSWSPEQIAGRLKIEYASLSISAETIYRYIYSKKAKRYKLWKFLPLKRTKRMRKMGRKVKRYEHILGLISIDQRPQEVNLRQTLGHWETDGLEGRRSDKSVISKAIITLTSDNGKENSNYTKITDNLKLKFFFCHPYSPWEKGTVENTNGRIRRFLPKKLV